MSLLLDALRRASAARQAPGEPVGRGEGEPPTANGDTDAGIDSVELSPEREASAGAAGGLQRPIPWPAAAADQAVARAVLSAGRPRRVGRRLYAALGIAVAVAAVVGGVWYAAEMTQARVASGLAAYDPGAAEARIDTDSAVASEDDAPGEGQDAEATAGAAVAADQDGGASPADGAAASSGGSAEGSRSGGSAEGSSTGEQASSAGPSTDASEATDTADAEQAPTPTGDAAGSDAGGSDEPSADGADTAPAGEPDGEAVGPERSTRSASARIEASQATPLRDALEVGYRALQAGELVRADRAYRRALERAPNNRDALIGAAAVAQRQGRPAAAKRLYRRVLGQNPRDAYARAALAALQGESQPRRTESELKRLLRDNPASPALHFALGNVYAGESRWSDAQQAYFEAVRAAPENPDYAYNLAVALDHLGQRDAARRYYARALDLADPRSASFDERAARQRLQQLAGKASGDDGGS